MSTSTFPLAWLLAFAAGATAVAQDTRPVAFTNARLITVSGAVIERGTLVLKNGKIDAVGADVAVPPGARVVDATGKTLMPGLVNAWSRAGLQARGAPPEERMGGGRRGGRMDFPMPAPGGGPAANKAATKVVDGLYAKQPVFGELLRAGITSLALTPAGGGFPGLGAVLRPDGKTLEQMTSDDDAFVHVGMVRDAQTKKLLKETFEKAQKVVDERKKPPEKPPAPAEPKPAEPKAGEAKGEPAKGNEPPKPEPKPDPKPEPKPEPKPDEKKDTPPAGAQGQPAPRPAAAPAAKDPNLEVLADLLEGKRRAVVQIDSAADLLHWLDAVADTVKFPRALAMTRHDATAGTIDKVLEQVKAWQCPVLVAPDMATLPRSRVLTHPAKQLHEAGVELAFVLGDNQATVRLLFFRLMDLVRYGLPADVALRAITLVPAKILGIDKQVGSLEVGKDANVLVFTGDPLAPSSQLEAVWLAGQRVPPQP